MITQREINAFFTILDVLADPEKAREQLTVLQNMRASVDADLARVGEVTQRNQNTLNEARHMMTSAKELERAANEKNEINAELAKALAAKDKEQRENANRAQEINRLLNVRDGELRDREQELTEKIKRYETSLADHNVRNEALRKKEAEYRERMEKLKQITN